VTSLFKDEPDDVPVGSTRDDVELLVLHDVEKLSANLARLAKRLGVQEVFRRPIVSVAGFETVEHQ
jgi:hypothetical protein